MNGVKTVENINLSGMSAHSLMKLAKRAMLLADDLRKEQPTYDLAIEAGVKDKSYRTVRYGIVLSFGGEAIVEMENGKKWKCIGRGPKGDASHLSHDGFIEFIPMD